MLIDTRTGEDSWAAGLALLLGLSCTAAADGHSVPPSTAPASAPQRPVAAARASAPLSSASSDTATPEPALVPRIVLGSRHGCSLDRAGVTRCWGDNGSGQHGMGDRDRRHDLDVVAVRARQIDAGDSATCILNAAREVWCWGHPFGDAPKTRLAEQVDQMSVHAGMVCLRRGARAVCSDHREREQVRRSLVFEDVASVAAGSSFACALGRDEQVRCAGSDDRGQLGQAAPCPEHPWRCFDPAPKPVAIAGAKHLTTSYDGACAVATGGRLVCWGDSLPPRPGPQDMGLDGIVDASGGLKAGCARSKDGRVSCWRFDPGSTPAPRAIALPRAATRIAGTGDLACAALDDGAVFCWGKYARYVPMPIPATAGRPTVLSPLRGADEIVLGETSGCLRRGSDVACWGRNGGVLRTGALADAPMTTPATDVPPLRLLTMGDDYLCGLGNDRETYCWGDADEPTGRPSPRVVRSREGVAAFFRAMKDPAFRARVESEALKRGAPRAIGGLREITSVRAGARSACALDARGQVFCWGRDAVSSSAKPPSQPRPRRTPLPSAAASLSVGNGSACVVHADGKVSCWGRIRTSEAAPAHASKPQTLESPTDASQVAVGFDFACARGSRGPVSCWGSLPGRGDEAPRPATRMPGPNSTSALCTGNQHACAVDETGQVWCWGQGEDGRLGLGRDVDRPDPTRVDGLTDAVDVVCGPSSTCARRKDGSVACWGSLLPESLLDVPAATAIPF